MFFKKKKAKPQKTAGMEQGTPKSKGDKILPSTNDIMPYNNLNFNEMIQKSMKHSDVGTNDMDIGQKTHNTALNRNQHGPDIIHNGNKLKVNSLKRPISCLSVGDSDNDGHSTKPITSIYKPKYATPSQQSEMQLLHDSVSKQKVHFNLNANTYVDIPNQNANKKRRNPEELRTAPNSPNPKLMRNSSKEFKLSKTKLSRKLRDECLELLRRTDVMDTSAHVVEEPKQPVVVVPEDMATMASRGQLVMEDMLKEVQNLVDGLKGKNEVAEWCLAQGNVVTDKLAVMKEYNQEVGYVNTFHAPEGRANLVASLQHESRQIQALQEDNRQLEYAIEEMEHGMEMMMARHREIIVNCRRSDKMLDLLAKLQLAPTPSNTEKTIEMAKLLQECIDEHSEENNRHLKDIARLKTENAVLRRLLNASSAENHKIDTFIDKLKDNPNSLDLLKPESLISNKIEDEESSKDTVIEVDMTDISSPTNSNMSDMSAA